MWEPLQPAIGIPLIIMCNGKRWVMDIVEVPIAYLHIFIPLVHGIDGLRELYTALLVDTAGVHPQPLIPVLLSLLTAIENLPIAITLAYFFPLLLVHSCELDYLIIIHFLPDPPMGQDCVLCDITELEDLSPTVHLLSLFHQSLPFK